MMSLEQHEDVDIPLCLRFEVGRVAPILFRETLRRRFPRRADAETAREPRDELVAVCDFRRDSSEEIAGAIR